MAKGHVGTWDAFGPGETRPEKQHPVQTNGGHEMNQMNEMDAINDQAEMDRNMNQTTKQKKSPPEPRNGVDTPTLFATINAVGAQPELAKFQFRATNCWQQGTHSRSRLESFSGAGGDHMHATAFEYDADHPPVLVGGDQGPTPVEFLLHGLAACLTAGIANIAAARGVNLTMVESTLEGDIDLQGILGLSDQVRNGYEKIRVSYRIEGDASDEKLREIVMQSRARSAVYDVLTNGVPVEITVNAE
jgi:uncharacterized OsmC-like protein